MKNAATFLIFTLFFIISDQCYVNAQNSETGVISGTVMDAGSNEFLIGAAVKIEGTRLGAICGLDGDFIIKNIPAGTHTVVAFMVGYKDEEVDSVEVVAGEKTVIEISINPEIINVKEIRVKARAIQNTEASLLMERQKEEAVTDAVSAEIMSSTGSSNAASAMKLITGTTVVDGKEVYVRGLGDRYMNVQLNGAEIPSTSQYKRSIQIDIFPSNLLDNIVTQKTFTPDKPGNFTGGSVNIKTKSFPDDFTLTFSASTSGNSQTAFNDDFFTYKGGDTDWLGIDDGIRDIPSELKSPNVYIPNDAAAGRDPVLAHTLDSYTKAFNRVMSPTQKQSPLNQGYSLTIGDQVEMFSRPLGLIGSLIYSNNYAFYENGEYNRWKLTGNVANKTELDNELLMSDSKSSNEVVLGSLLSATYKLHEDHELGVTFTYNRTGEDIVRVLKGSFPEADIDSKEGRVYNANVLHFNERSLSSTQIHGKHTLKNFYDSVVEWKTTLSTAAQSEPDLRYFNFHYKDRILDGENVRIYSLDVNQYKAPNRYFRELEENSGEYSLNIKIPVRELNGKESSVKFGGLLSIKERTFKERRFQYKLTKSNYIGNSETVFADSIFALTNLGMIGSSADQYNFGTHILDASEDRSNYDGDQDISAFYGMFDVYFIEQLRFIGGGRFEKTSMETISADSTYKKGVIDTNDLLPSVNLVYELKENVNLRAAYGRTLARPSFREMSPFPSEDFAGGFIFTGNPELKRTTIDNFDLRWEWFGMPGEVLAVSMFAKYFHNPIERVILNVNNEISFQNVKNARVQGIEFEFRKELKQVSDILENFKFGSNFSLVRSEVDIPDREMIIKLVSDPNASSTRKFEGQSPYTFNLTLNYNNSERGIKADIFFNTFGERLSAASIGATPCIYEQPYHTLNISFSKKISDRLSTKMSINNLLDAEHKDTQEFKGEEYIFTRHKTVRTFSIGLDYKI